MKFYLHKEGKKTLIVSILLASIGICTIFLCNFSLWYILLGIVLIIVATNSTLFFRMPIREYPLYDDNYVLAPADGTVVDISIMYEKEYFKDDRIKVSVFMSPYDVHVNRYPIKGSVSYHKYHPGKFLVAWHPKSSELNEHNSVVVKTVNGEEILVRQIAGIMARRIVCYSEVGKSIERAEELGFIKFGSRVDLFFPLNTNITAKLNEKVKSGISVITTI